MHYPTQIKLLITSFSHRVSITVAIIICVGNWQFSLVMSSIMGANGVTAAPPTEGAWRERLSRVIIVRRVECGVFPLNYRAHHASRAICKPHSGKNYLQTWGGNHLWCQIFYAFTTPPYCSSSCLQTCSCLSPPTVRTSLLHFPCKCANIEIEKSRARS